MDLVPEPGTDDDHVLAVFKYNQRYGAVAKSNFAGLRYREPVYSSLRELAISYFEMFYNIEGYKTLRGYTRPMNLAHYDRYDWETKQSGWILLLINSTIVKNTPLLKKGVQYLSPVDRRSYEAGMLGTNSTDCTNPRLVSKGFLPISRWVTRQ